MGCLPGHSKPGSEAGQQSALPMQRRCGLHRRGLLSTDLTLPTPVIARPFTRPTRRNSSQTSGRVRTPRAPARTSPRLRKTSSRRTVRLKERCDERGVEADTEVLCGVVHAFPDRAVGVGVISAAFVILWRPGLPDAIGKLLPADMDSWSRMARN
jgi:hypothetical protein